ncbi:molybdopterin molybdenumtransferase MoeA [Terasakiella brassicae]|uniref:Molybdopterin molybdenumtransferase n=1 Tax=Terasakiella brassicae TaxID=1634917 RepID=A0A917F700_9PROT|nr:gephyrin-like molybdotransferase Glp [Terasakiella brassicae]GGF52365.1 molybdopterin molybdenumtransferase MoeA [Terasakiella brassicae]
MSLIPLNDAFAKVEEGIRTLPAEMVSVADALGRVVAEDVAARLTQPPAPVSAMDGYAVVSSDIPEHPVSLKRIGESQAGGPFMGTVQSGQCVRIFTGAPLPAGTDAVIMQEDTEVDGDLITFKEVAFEGKFVRRAGLDFSKGDILIKKGQILSARDIGLLCAMNVPWVHVYRKPRVAILATGDELVMPGEALRDSQIISSNSLMVGAMVTAMGGEAINLGIADDSESSLRSMLAGVDGADLLVTSGGVSVGEYDLVRNVLGEEGLDIDVYRIAIKPGKPFMFGRIKDKPAMGLPGNPVSAYVTAFIFLRAALKKMQGLPFEQDKPIRAILGGAVKANGARQEFMRAVFAHNENGQLVATPYDKQDSAMLANLAHCEGFIIRPVNAPALDKGDETNVIYVRDSLLSV